MEITTFLVQWDNVQAELYHVLRESNKFAYGIKPSARAHESKE
jgi:hypothetical protein